MGEEFNLSDHVKRAVPTSIEMTKVREFIKLLKGLLLKNWNRDQEIIKEIDKLAGEKLNGI